MKETRPFSMKVKIGYTLGDLGCCCTEQFRAMYLAIFYTLVLKVNPVHVGILMLVTKFWDAINDPLIGALVDSSHPCVGDAVDAVVSISSYGTVLVIGIHHGVNKVLTESVAVCKEEILGI